MATDAKRINVVIVGAGASGLAAAAKLSSAGFSVRVLEAQNRTGGRVFSENLGSGEFIEYGAQWIHGEKHGVYELAKQHGLILEKRTDSLDDEDEATGDFVVNSGRIISDAENETVEDFLLRMDEVLVDLERRIGFTDDELAQDVENIIARKFEALLERYDEDQKDLVKAAFNWFKTYQLVDNGCKSLKDLSAKAFSEYSLEGDNTTRLKVPLSKLLAHLSENLSPSTISLNKPVQHIIMNDNYNSPTKFSSPLTIECADGEKIPADHVIVTVSLGVLKACSDLFHPRLPERKRLAIDAAGFGAIGKVILRYDEPFWEKLDPRTEGFQLLWLPAKNQDFEWEKSWFKWVLGFDLVKTAKNTLVMWVAPPGVRELESLNNDQLAANCTELLRKFTGSETIPLPISLLCEKWATNPYTRGTYSWISMESVQAGLSIDNLAEPVWHSISSHNGKELPLVLFAGEATFPLYWSTIHGAILSGWREADRLISSYQ